MEDDGKIYHYKAEKIVGITAPNASKINSQNKSA